MPIEDAREWAALFDYADDTAVSALILDGTERGWLTADELREIIRWKSGARQAANASRLSDGAVRAATEAAFRPDASDRERLRALMQLPGVAMPTASVVLHFHDPQRWSIIDWRALEACGHPDPRRVHYSYRLWEEYQERTGGWAAAAGVTRRVLDKALGPIPSTASEADAALPRRWDLRNELEHPRQAGLSGSVRRTPTGQAVDSPASR